MTKVAGLNKPGGVIYSAWPQLDGVKLLQKVKPPPAADNGERKPALPEASTFVNGTARKSAGPRSLRYAFSSINRVRVCPQEFRLTEGASRRERKGSCEGWPSNYQKPGVLNFFGLGKNRGEWFD